MSTVCVGTTPRPPKWISRSSRAWLTRRQRVAAGCTKSSTTATACAHRRRQGCAADPHRARLASSLPTHYRGAWLPEGAVGLYRRRALRTQCRRRAVFNRLQAAMDEGRTDQLIYFAFDLLFLNSVSTARLPLIKRKEWLQRLFKKEIGGLRYSEHVAGDGPSSAHKPASWAWRALSPSKPIGHMHQATAGSG